MILSKQVRHVVKIIKTITSIFVSINFSWWKHFLVLCIWYYGTLQNSRNLKCTKTAIKDAIWRELILHDDLGVFFGMRSSRNPVNWYANVILESMFTLNQFYNRINWGFTLLNYKSQDQKSTYNRPILIIQNSWIVCYICHPSHIPLIRLSSITC